MNTVNTQDATPAENRNVPPVVLDDDEAIGSFKKHVKNYKYFDSFDDMLEAINTASQKTDDFAGLPFYHVGIDRVTREPTEDDPRDYEYVAAENAADFYAEGIPTLGYGSGHKQVKRDGKTENQTVIKFVLAMAIPTVDVAIAEERDVVAKILGKEWRHVAFRGFRDATSLAELDSAFAQMPVGIEAFAASHAKSAAEQLDTESFDAVWPGLRAAWIGENPEYKRLMPPKAEVIKCIRSQSYAEGTQWRKLEEIKFFLRIAVAIVKVADSPENPELSGQAVKEWVQGRKDLHIPFRSIDDSDISAIGEFSEDEAMEALGL